MQTLVVTILNNNMKIVFFHFIFAFNYSFGNRPLVLKRILGIHSRFLSSIRFTRTRIDHFVLGKTNFKNK